MADVCIAIYRTCARGVRLWIATCHTNHPSQRLQDWCEGTAGYLHPVRSTAECYWNGGVELRALGDAVFWHGKQCNSRSHLEFLVVFMVFMQWWHPV